MIAIELVGYLSAESLESRLAPVRKQLADVATAQRACLLVDAQLMTDYDPAARDRSCVSGSTSASACAVWQS